jgi:mannose-6-phosphate isomerase-like protein (cupin superfamily)
VITTTTYASATPFITKDGSQIRELMHPTAHGNRALSFAEAIVEPGANTLPHYHRATEEIYHITHGVGRMMLGDESFTIQVGDTVCIAPGTVHGVVNTGDVPLKILCACAPAYSHEDTVLVSQVLNA